MIFGALVSFLVNRRYKQREQQASSAEKLKIPALKQRGLVLACGLVAGAAITGVVMAIPAVLMKNSAALSIVPISFTPYADILSVIVTIGLCYWIYTMATKK